MKAKVCPLSGSISYSWRNFIHEFEKVYIFFWVSSLFGHYLELLWAQLKHIITGRSAWQPIDLTIVPIAPPYGLGAIVVVFVIWPLVKYYKMPPVVVFFFSAVVTALVEYICAVIILAIYGYNRFWDYSWMPFNVNGHVCLENSLLFGLVATIFIYWLFPSLNRFLSRLSAKQFSTLFWVLFISYGVDLTVSLLK